MKIYYVYIMTNWDHTVYYTGVTNNLERRLLEHRNKVNKGFTQKYNINKLVFFQEFGSIYEALESEKMVKKWRREKKINLIESNNPKWKNLF
jgi:putative endonuclease